MMDHIHSKKIQLAVLPFRNISSGPEMDFFSDGISEEIIFALARIDELKVISRSSSFQFKGQQAPIKEIAERLGVNLILEGSIRIRNEALRISAQLIQAADDTYLWSETWDRKLENLFAIQDEISLLIADQIREHTGHLSISDHLVETPTSNLDAYQHFLKGRFHFNQWNPEDIQIAIREFESAVALDDTMIDSHVGLADAYSFMAVAGFAPREIAWTKAIHAMNTAREIDPDHAGLNYMLANQAFFTEADFLKSKKCALKALATAPTFEHAHRFLSFLFILEGDAAESKKHLLYAKSIDPLNPETLFYEAFYGYRMGEYQASLDILDQLLKENPANLPALVISLYVKIKLKRLGEAQQQIEETAEEVFTPDERVGLLCLIEVSRKDVQLDHLAELETKAKDPAAHHAHAYLFMVYVILGKFQQAIDILQKLFEHQSSILLLTFSNPLADQIHRHPSYQDLHRKVYPALSIAPPKAVPKSPKPDETTIQRDLAKLGRFMESEQPFLNPALSLRLLASSLDIHPNHLSWLLNQVIGKNYNEYINHKRIEHFKQLSKDPSNAHISLIGLAYESGFNSKSVFNTAFKKEVGMTPREYQRAQLS